MQRTNPYLGMGPTLLAEAAAALTTRNWSVVRKGNTGQPTAAFEANLTSRPDPYGVFLDADGRVVVDDFVNPISNIPMILREFTADNEGYWIDRVFNDPGWTIQGGAIAYALTEVGDHFLPDGQRPAPRAPGAEAPRVGGTRKRPIVAYPENLSASIEVADETRRRNDVGQVQMTFRQVANTFADIMQDVGEAALDALVAAANRNVYGGTGTFTAWAAADPIYNNTSTDPRPSAELARVRRLYQQEKGGVIPDTAVWSPEDAEHFDRVYEDRGDAVLARYGIRQLFISTRRPAGKRLYLRSGQVGYRAWEKPVDTEPSREANRKTDVFTLDGAYAFVANGADAILQVNDTVAP